MRTRWSRRVFEAGPLVFALFGCTLPSSCESCGERAKTRAAAQRASPEECSARAQCADDDPCTQEDCIDGRCETSFAAEGTSCDNETVCDGISRCDGQGRCLAGAAPTFDDGNRCTVDTCDPVRGVTHEPVLVDDFDACTRDACNPATGHITHDSVDIDDHDDCTLDSCNPQTGIQHQRPSSLYTCGASCGPGFHAASRAVNAQCGSKEALQTFCVPDCGESFHSCDTGCPARYQKKSEAANTQCGSRSSIMIFCLKQ
jgi:hypothetical protein